MSGCSLVAPGLPSLIGSQVPTFSYNTTAHASTDYFGIQMTYMSGTSTCYSGTMPTFTPVVSNYWGFETYTCQYVTQGYPATYTGIFCPSALLNNWNNNAAYTIDNNQGLFGFLLPTPRAFTATFGASPAPQTAFATVSTTFTSTQASTAPVQPAASTTLSVASATTTATTVVSASSAVTVLLTNLVSVCPTPVPTTSSILIPAPLPTISSILIPAPLPDTSSVVIPAPLPATSSILVPAPLPTTSSILIPAPLPTTSSIQTPVVPSSSSVRPAPTSSSVQSPAPVSPSSSLPSPSAIALSCPASDGMTFNTPRGAFVVACYIDFFDFDMGTASANTYEQCIQACAATTGCQAVSYLPNGPCYLKSGVGAPNRNGNVWGARLESATRSSTSTAPATTTSAVNTSPSAGAVCPASDGQVVTVGGDQYQVECGIDRMGGDLGNPVYPGSYEGCLASCSSTSGCVSVTYIMNGPCYMKSTLGTPKQLANAIAGRKLGGIQSASSVVSTSTPASTAVATSAPAPSAPVSPVAPSTVTVTTTISNLPYQCACTPSSTVVASGTLACPAANGMTYTSACGAKYVVECSVDRFGDDIPNGGIASTNSLNECLETCSKTPTCVAVSWVIGTPGTCYMKSSVGTIRQNSNIWAGRQISGCTSSTKLKLHRKRVAPMQPRKQLEKRLVLGPDFTFTRSTTTVTRTSSALTTVSTTVIPANSGTATTTVYTLARTTATSTVTPTISFTTTVTTCPATATPFV